MPLATQGTQNDGERIQRRLYDAISSVFPRIESDGSESGPRRRRPTGGVDDDDGRHGRVAAAVQRRQQTGQQLVVGVVVVVALLLLHPKGPSRSDKKNSHFLPLFFCLFLCTNPVFFSKFISKTANDPPVKFGLRH